MASEATDYTRNDDFADGDTIVETVSGANESSCKEEYDRVAAVLSQTGGSAIPAVFKSEDLKLRGGLDFANAYDIDNVRAINDGVFSVKGYGAVGDGTTDDRAAIINCIDAAIAAGGGIIYFEPVSTPATQYYKLEDEIDFSADITGTAANLTFVGSGRSSRILIESAGSHDIFELAAAENIQFHNLHFLSDSGQTGGTFLNNAGSYFKLKNCWFTSNSTSMTGAFDFSTTQQNLYPSIQDVYIAGSYTGNVVDIVRTRGCKVRDLGMDLTAGTPNDALRISANGSGDNESLVIDGLRINRTAGDADGTCVRVTTSHNEHVTINNYHLINAVANSTDTGVIEAASVEGLLIGQGRIFVNSDDANNDGIRLNSSTDCFIQGAFIKGNGGSGAGTGIDITSAQSPHINGCNVQDFGAGTGLLGVTSAASGAGGVGTGNTLVGNGTNLGTITNFLFDLTHANIAP